MGKKLLLLAAALLFLPSAVWADSTANFFFNGGTLSATDSTLSLSGSPVTTVTGFNGPSTVGSNLATVSFTTGTLQTGTTENGVFLAGGNFTILGSGTNGIPAGVLFSGTFNSRSGWSQYNFLDGRHFHVLHGQLDGNWLGQSVISAPMELVVQTQGASFSSAGQVVQGSVLLPFQVPEPGPISFITMGMVGLGAAFLSKCKTT